MRGIGIGLTLAAGWVLGCGGADAAKDAGTETAPDAIGETAAEVEDGTVADAVEDAVAETFAEVPPEGVQDPGPETVQDAPLDVETGEIPGPMDVPAEAIQPPDTIPGEIVEDDAVVLYPDCRSLSDCIDACPDDPCRQACVQASSQPARDDRLAFEDCLQAQCPDCVAHQDCDSCRNQAILGACREVAASCIEFPDGKDPCVVVLACVKGCSNATCGNTCMADIAVAAQVLFDDLGACMTVACPELDGPYWNACVASASIGDCKAQYDACAAQITLP